mgnify:CR=1 FL=1
MIVTRIGLTDFRNYRSADVELVAGANLFVGRNGQGKTNLVEALGYLSTLTSHRVSTDHAMIRQGADSSIVRARLEYGERSALVEVELNRTGPNRAALNRVAMKVRELPRHVSTVVFAPEDLAIVRGEPSVRRRFLDELLVLLSPRIAGVIADYDRVVRQRNTLLKTARSTGAKELSTLDVWDDKLVSLGSELIVARAELVRDLEPHVIAAYHSIAGTEHTVRLASQLSVLASDPDVDPAEASVEDLTLEHVTQNFRSALANLRPRERERAVTLVGPHRDDVLLELNGMPARGYASHGESWSLALSLKLAAAEVLRRDSLLGDPVLVLDDVFAELDESRRQRLAVAIDGFEQVLITAAVLGDVPPALAGHTVRIEGGTIVETSSG